MPPVSSTSSSTDSTALYQIAGVGTSVGASSVQRRAIRTLENWQRAGARDYVHRLQSLQEAVDELQQVIEDSDLLGTRSGAVRFGSEQVLGLSAGDESSVMQSVGAFSSVSAGSFQVNGVTITVDPTVDSLQDVLDRIEASDAATHATYSDSDHVTLKAHGSLSVNADTSGLLDAMHIQEGLKRNHGGTPSQVREGARVITQAIRKLQDPINDIYTDVQYETYAQTQLVTARSAMQTALRLAFGGDTATSFGTTWGFHLDTTDTDIEVGDTVIDLTTADLTSIRQALTDSPDEVLEFLAGEDGFLSSLEDGITRSLDNLGEQMGYSGSLLSVLI